MSDLFAMLQAAAGNAGEDVDPNFNQTVLLLHGDGTDGAQNNTFLDASTNNFTATRHGNPTQGTFSPFSLAAGEFSNFFDGSGDYLTLAHNAALSVGASDFTIEFWIYPTSFASANRFVYFKRGVIEDRGIGVGIVQTTGVVRLLAGDSDNTAWEVNLDGSTALTINAWNHVAVTRDSSTWTIWLNGVSDGTASASFTVDDGSGTAYLGSSSTTTNFFEGYLSNFRLVVGTALYTTGFTPSTSPLTTTSQGATSSEVELLTCQSNRFVDNSSNAFAITRNGDVKVTPFSPFAPTAAYDASVNGGSGYFDGTGDEVSFGSDSVFHLSSTATATIDAWIYPTSVGAQKGIIGYYYFADAVGEWGWALLLASDSKLKFVVPRASVGLNSTATVKPNEWNYVSAVITSGTIQLYINGVASGSTASFGNAGYTYGRMSIGALLQNNASAQSFPGYISNARVVNGTAIVPSGVPTSPLTAVTNTALLANFTNAGIFDQTGKNNLETVGNAQIDTTTKKYGTGSMEFDGSGDYLAIPASQDFAFGTGDFTFECWINTSNVPSVNNDRIIRIGANNVTGNFQIVITTGEVVRVDSGPSILITGSVDVVDGAWHHIAVTRSGTDLKLFVDGTQDGSTATNSTNFNQTVAQIGYDSTVASSEYTGFIDDLRITKGVARYTTTFTPPTKAFPDL